MNVQVKNKNNIVLQGSGGVYEIMCLILKREKKLSKTKERLWTIALDISQKILNIELVSLGSISSIVVTPAEILSIPLQKKASSIILVHNYPSGNLEPSSEDQDRTDHIIQAASLVNIKVKDHLIISEHSYYSFLNSGLLTELERSTKYVPLYKLEEMVRKDISLEKDLEMGKKLIEKGFDISLIKEITGLSSSQLEGLLKHMREER
jgi:DNA repair protein RadC